MLDVERLSISAKINRDLHRWHNNIFILSSENMKERKPTKKNAFEGEPRKITSYE